MNSLVSICLMMFAISLPINLFSLDYFNYCKLTNQKSNVDSIKVFDAESFENLKKTLQNVDTIQYLKITCEKCSDEVADALNNTSVYIKEVVISHSYDIKTFKISNLNTSSLIITSNKFDSLHLSDLPQSLTSLVLTSVFQAKKTKYYQGIDTIFNSCFIDDGNFSNLEILIIDGTILSGKGNFPKSLLFSKNSLKELLFFNFDCRYFTIFPNLFLEMPKLNLVEHDYGCYDVRSIIYKYSKLFKERNIEYHF